MSAEIIPLFDPKSRCLLKRKRAVDMGLGLGVGRKYSSAEVERLVEHLRMAMALNASDNLT
jgi:hypothetical protein